MKKVLVSAILGLAAIASVQAQSFVTLYNYGTASAGSITYGQATGGTAGTGITGGFTVGLMWVAGSQVAAVDTATGGASTGVAGVNNGSLTGVAGLALATGSGATVALGTDGPGVYDATTSAILNPSGGATVYTLVLLAYNGATYESSAIRGHSAAFTMTAATPPTIPDSSIYTGAFAPAAGFSVALVPEPSTFALAGLGLASLLIFRRRK